MVEVHYDDFFNCWLANGLVALNLTSLAEEVNSHGLLMYRTLPDLPL